MIELFSSKEERNESFEKFLEHISNEVREKNKPKAKVEYEITVTSSLETMKNIVTKLIDIHEGKQELNIKVKLNC